MANLTGISQVPQTLMNQIQKPALTFQGQQPTVSFNGGQIKADMVTFGADPKIEAATEVAKQVGKIAAVKNLLGKLSAPVIKVVKAVIALLGKCLKALNPMPLLKKVAGLFSKGAGKVKEVAQKGVEVAKDVVQKGTEAVKGAVTKKGAEAVTNVPYQSIH